MNKAKRYSFIAVVLLIASWALLQENKVSRESVAPKDDTISSEPLWVQELDALPPMPEPPKKRAAAPGDQRPAPSQEILTRLLRQRDLTDASEATFLAYLSALSEGRISNIPTPFFLNRIMFRLAIDGKDKAKIAEALIHLGTLDPLPIFRDYALQNLAMMLINDARLVTRINNVLLQSSRDHSTHIGGTALLALSHRVDEAEEPEKLAKQAGYSAMQVVENPEADILAKTSAVHVAMQCVPERAEAATRAIIDSDAPIHLRAAAVAALGTYMQNFDTAYFASLSQDPEPRIRVAAEAVLKKKSQREMKATHTTALNTNTTE